MMYDIEIFLSIRFRTPTSKREVGVFKNLHICVFWTPNAHLRAPPGPPKYKKKSNNNNNNN